ncbi:MAG: hypothetical protein WBF34_08055 [Streptosporangiaceae bacterium]|jgi:hypothetical protein
MPTVTVPSANVTVEQVSAVLREKLGPRYKITPATTSRFHHQFPAGANSILVRRHWFEQASIRVIAAPDSTEIHVGSAANFTPTGLLINRAGIMHKVHQVLQRAPELASS